MAGAYSWVARVGDGEGRARVPSQSPGRAQDCCGSEFPVSSTIPTPSFTRVVTGASFYMTEGVQFFIRDENFKYLFYEIDIFWLKLNKLSSI